MQFPAIRWPRGRLRIFDPANIPAAIALVVIVASGLFADYQNSQVFAQRLRADVLSQVSLLRARLEGNINSNIQLVRGLVATLSTEPDMAQDRFSTLAASVFARNSQLRNIAAAPDLVVSMVHPREGNEKAMGLDYRANKDQRPDVLKAWATRELVLAGPVHLVQGGKAIIGRFPVFVPDEAGHSRFWGIVSAVVDAESLYAESGLYDSELPIEVALVKQVQPGDSGTPFFGEAAVLKNDPVIASVLLPSGSWQIAAIPKSGWNVMPDNAWLLRLIIVAAGALAFFPIWISGRLISERHQNIAELRLREEQLHHLSQRLELALDSSDVGVWELHIDSGLLVWDARMNELHGLSPHGGIHTAKQWQEAIHPEDVERATAEARHAIESRERYYSEYRIVTPEGEVRTIRSVGAVYQEDGGPARFIGVNIDITRDVALNEALRQAKVVAEARNADLEAAKARIEHNALHDSLTGLPNRRYLDEVLTGQAARFGRSGGHMALLHIDLDRFKQINDTLGHAAGDAMLVHVAQVLRSNVRPGDFVARIGGDEFVILCVSEHEPGHVAALADRIIAKMRHPVFYEGQECRFGVSIGIARDQGGSLDPKQLLINADIALYRAKHRGRNRYEYFTSTLQGEIVSNKRIADEILAGLENDEFIAHFQPQFRAGTLELSGMEALVRWNHPSRGLLGPESFIRVAEEIGVLANIDKLVLEQALGQRREWVQAGLAVPRVSVNVSAKRLHDETLLEGLRDLSIEPGTVAFELVESIYLDKSDDIATWNIDRVRDLGIDFEIDDFGTGYASIVSLLQLRPARLKIDQQLVMPIVESQARRQLVQSIIEIGRSLGIEVVAEGVETMRHAEILDELGCDYLQGYAFAKPMSPADLGLLLKTRSWQAAAS